MQTTPCFFGIDVASQWLDIHDGKTDKPLRITNTLTAISRWLDTLPPHAFIALEVTGPTIFFWRPLPTRQGLPFS